MTDLLMTLAEISLTMSAVILLLLALGPLLARRYAARWRYWAWLVVAVRLLVPLNLSLPRAPVQLEAPADRIVYTYPPPAAPSAAPVGPEFSAESPAPLPSVPPETSSGRGRLSARVLAPSSFTRAVDRRSSRFSARERAADTPKVSVTVGAKGCTSSSSLRRVSSSRAMCPARACSTASRFLAASAATTHASR